MLFPTLFVPTFTSQYKWSKLNHIAHSVKMTVGYRPGLCSQKTPHSLPSRASYGVSLVSILLKNNYVTLTFVSPQQYWTKQKCWHVWWAVTVPGWLIAHRHSSHRSQARMLCIYWNGEYTEIQIFVCMQIVYICQYFPRIGNFTYCLPHMEL